MGRSSNAIKLVVSLLVASATGLVVTADLVGCKVGCPVRGPETCRAEIEEAADGLAAGLKTDPFFDGEADRADVLRRRQEVLEPAAAPDGKDASKPSPDRAARLHLLYMLAIDAILAFDSAVDGAERRALREATEGYVRRARSELAEKNLPADFDAGRYAANLRFLSALSWLLEGGAPDARCLGDLRFAAEHDGDYRAAAQTVLRRAPDEDRYDQGLAAMERGDGAAAAAAFGHHLDRYPDDLEARRWRGLARVAAGDPAAALADFDACLTRSPRDAVALEGRGHALYRLGRVDDAITAWQAAADASAQRAPTLNQYMRAARGG